MNAMINIPLMLLKGVFFLIPPLIVAFLPVIFCMIFFGPGAVNEITFCVLFGVWAFTVGLLFTIWWVTFTDEITFLKGVSKDEHH